jgi:hypothetical protein
MKSAVSWDKMNDARPMTKSCRQTTGVLALAWLIAAAAVQAATPVELLQQLDAFPHAKSIRFETSEVLDYEIGLGAMQKIGGVWQFKHSERVSGTLTEYTWQIIDGFGATEVMGELIARVQELPDVALLFSCDGRACGQGVQWANRVFHQSVLYGQEDRQRYRVFAVGDAPRQLLLLYASARTADRQYLHAEAISVTP